jgi:hypothetical protein
MGSIWNTSGNGPGWPNQLFLSAGNSYKSIQQFWGETMGALSPVASRATRLGKQTRNSQIDWLEVDDRARGFEDNQKSNFGSAIARIF